MKTDKRKVPLWLTDQNGHMYHAKCDSNGCLYIVDNLLNKRFDLPAVGECQVGKVFDGTALYYGKYTVVRNDVYLNFPCFEPLQQNLDNV